MSVSRPLPLSRVGSVALAAVLTVTGVLIDAPSFAAALPGAQSRAGLPAGALTSAQNVTIDGVGCSSTNTCVAVGNYLDATGFRPLLLTELRGHWVNSAVASLPGDAVLSPANAGATATSLNAVACPTGGDCVAVGTYRTAAGAEPLIVTRTAGVWQAGVRLVLPAKAASTSQAASLFSVSCSSTGNCTAVGSFLDALGARWPLAVTQHGGSWTPAVIPALPSAAVTSDQFASLNAVRCFAPGTCLAVGGAVTALGYQPIALTEVSGVWGVAAAGALITLPGDATGQSTAEADTLNALACASATTCVAVGQYAVATGYVAMATSLSTGTWSPAARINAPSAPVISGPQAGTLTAVSCTTGNSCVAVGTWGSATQQLAMSVASTGGVFGVASAATVSLADATAPADNLYGAVWCFGTNQCLLAGSYRTASGQQGLLSTPRTTPGAPSGVVATRANAAASVKWLAPAYDGTTPVTSYVVTATPGSATCTTATLTCVVHSLANGTRYSFRVVAINAVGISAPSAASNTVSPATIPSAPTILSLSALAGALRLSLRAPSSNGGATITKYQYSVNGGTTWHNRTDGSTSLTLTILGLLRHHTYHVTVRAVNGAGTGAASKVLAATTK